MLEIEGIHVTVPQAVTHVLLGLQSSLCLSLSLHLAARERNMLSFYALHSLLVLSSHCNTAVFQHTNNWDCGGSSPLHCAASHPGVTTCQGTVSLRPQLHSPPDFTMPALLLIHNPHKLLFYICMLLLSCIKYGCTCTYRCSG